MAMSSGPPTSTSESDSGAYELANIGGTRAAQFGGQYADDAGLPRTLPSYSVNEPFMVDESRERLVAHCSTVIDTDGNNGVSQPL